MTWQRLTWLANIDFTFGEGMELNTKAADSAQNAAQAANENIGKALKCEWEDSVHDSFYGFHTDFSETSKQLTDICQRITDIGRSVRDVDVEKMQKTLSVLRNHMPGE